MRTRSIVGHILGGWEMSVNWEIPSVPIQRGLYHGNGGALGIGMP